MTRFDELIAVLQSYKSKGILTFGDYLNSIKQGK